MLSQDPELRAYLDPDEVRALFEVETHIGDAPSRARVMADRIRARLDATPMDTADV
jgi:hypothetical protein